nr:von Willebrand factor C and EGF domain-containing protein [Drosophila suzukii]XP_036670553.1 von Willebrand factor C and EGF domain-containing protein [Drosophila suzukii]
MAKLIILCCFLWNLKALALPIIDPDSYPEEMCPPCLNDFPICGNVIVEVERGNGLPGSCCPRYECRDEEPVCDDSKMRFYKNKCTVCDPCEPQAVQCKEMCELEEEIPICLTDKNEYKELDNVWEEDNGCTTATCLGGFVSRKTIQCNHEYPCSNPIAIKGICCLVCPEELDEDGSYYGHLPFDGTTQGSEVIGDDGSTEEITIKYMNSTTSPEISTPISDEVESSSSVNSSTIPTESSTIVSDASESSSVANNSTTTTEMYTPTPITSESTSTGVINTESSFESLGVMFSSESPDLKHPEEEETSSSDFPTETTTNPTTTDDLETSKGSSTSLETYTNDGITKIDLGADKTTDGKIDISTETAKINFSVMTDSPITNQPEALAPESTSQVKDPNDTEVLRIKSHHNYVDVPQEQIKHDYTWIFGGAVVGVVGVLVALIITYWIYKRYYSTKKYDIIPGRELSSYVNVRCKDTKENEGLVVIPAQTNS